MSLRVVVLHSDMADPIAEVLSDAEVVTCIHIDQIAEHWCVGAGLVPLLCNYPDSLVSMFQGAIVVNRVFGFGNSRAGFYLEDAGLHVQWGYMALRPLLRVAASIAHGNDCRGVTRALLPLNIQWYAMANACPEISYPEFAFGFGRVMPPLDHLYDPMQKSLWSYFSWKEERNLSDDERNWHRFFVERPVGTPVICFFHGRQVDFKFPYGEPIDVDRAIYRRVAQAASEVFESRMGEILMYVPQGRPPQFCAFSPYMANAVRTPGFGQALLASLTGQVR